MSYNLDQLKASGVLDLPEPYKCATCPYCNGAKDPKPRFEKPEPWKWWREQLKEPKYVVAPMVDQSELPYRMLCRKYGATLAYTPMFHSSNFSQFPGYREREFQTCPEDRPLFVQFCGHDADTVLAAAMHVVGQCDAVDLNLGCPQGIAKKGFYGSFLMERWDVIHTILHTLSVELPIPVTAKMRVFDDLSLTLRYARMLRDTGIHLLTVHGRTREMKGQFTGLADLDKIAAVKREIRNIPVLANGNILQFSDIALNLEKTRCDGVMSAEALLWDARLFADVPDYVLTGRGFIAGRMQRLASLNCCREYLSLVMGKYPCPAAYAKSHVFKMCHHSMEVHQQMRVALGKISNDKEGGDRQAFLEMAAVVEELIELEKNCDIDIYVRNHPRPREDEGESVIEPNEQLRKQHEGAAAAAATATGHSAAPARNKLEKAANYDANVDDAIGEMFSSG